VVKVELDAKEKYVIELALKLALDKWPKIKSKTANQKKYIELAQKLLNFFKVECK
jgi:hypothetical protein